MEGKIDIKEFGEKIRALAEAVAERDRATYEKIQKAILENVNGGAGIGKYVHDIVVNLTDVVMKYKHKDKRIKDGSVSSFVKNIDNLKKDLSYYKSLITMAFLTDY